MLDKLRFALVLIVGVAAALLVLVAVAPEGSCIHALIRGDGALQKQGWARPPSLNHCGRMR